MKQEKSKVVFITGAARGIGKSIALALAQEGMDLILTDIDAEALKETEGELSRFNGIRKMVEMMNVADFENVRDVVDRTAKTMGGLHVLVNNAGITRDALFIRMKKDAWQQVLDVNLTGTFNCCRAAIKYMVKQRYGRIINIISVAGLMGNVGQANYAASKAGVFGMTKTLAKEYAARGITVNAVAPGAVETEMTAALDEKVRQEILESIPMNRFAAVEEIAGCVRFLASDAAAYITGQVINVNGGMYM